MRMRKPESRRSVRRVLGIRSPLYALLALVAVFAVAGCGSSHHKTHTSTTTTTSTGTVHPAAAPKPLAVVPAVIDDGTRAENLHLSIYDVRRDGPYVVLDFGITCVNGSSTPCDGELDFAAPAHSGPQVTANADTASGVALVDPSAQKEYQPVRDSQYRPFASQLPGSIADSYEHLAWVVFPAPPTSVTSVDVAFPNGGPQVPGVPISSSASPPTAGGNLVAAQPAPFAASLGSTDTTGLSLPVENLVDTVGNPNGSDSESATQDTITLRSDVLFHFDKSNLTPTAHTILTQLAPQIKARAVGPVSVTGYTDSIGTDAVNIPLSEARASSVVSALQPLTPGVTYKSQGLGSADPVAPNTEPNGTDDPAGRALNRRVTIAFAVKAPTPPTPPPAAPATPTGPAGQAGAVSFAVPDGQSTSHYRLTVDGLYREADLVVLKMTVECTGITGATAGSTCDGETELEGTPTVPPQPESADSAAFDTASAFYLRDPVTGTEYIPLHDTDRRPLTAGVDVYLGVGQSYPMWAYFPAPASSTSALTVVVPGGSQSVANVPISSSPPPAQP
jgi:OOP family OmpA-OmpF porin